MHKNVFSEMNFQTFLVEDLGSLLLSSCTTTLKIFFVSCVWAKNDWKTHTSLSAVTFAINNPCFWGSICVNISKALNLSSLWIDLSFKVAKKCANFYQSSHFSSGFYVKFVVIWWSLLSCATTKHVNGYQLLIWLVLTVSELVLR